MTSEAKEGMLRSYPKEGSRQKPKRADQFRIVLGPRTEDHDEQQLMANILNEFSPVEMVTVPGSVRTHDDDLQRYFYCHVNPSTRTERIPVY